MTELELVAIEERVAAATGGPWTSVIEGRDQFGGSSVIITAGEDLYLNGGTAADQDFVAHARQDVPRLLAEIRRLLAMTSR